MEKEIKKLNFGLKPLSEEKLKSKKTFSLASVFGIPRLEDIPDEFVVAIPRFIKDQKFLDTCTGNGVVAASEDQEVEVGELSEEFQFFLTKIYVAKDPSSYGANLMDACQSAVDYGSLPKLLAYEFLKNPYDRDEILNKNTWPESMLPIAQKLRKGSYFKVDGPYDIFDNLRANLWQHKADKCTAVVGCLWRNTWTYIESGIIPKAYESTGGGHCFKIFGVKKIDNELYLMAQLSNGTDIGDKGIFYFPRAVVNREFLYYGQFMFKDLPKEEAQYYHENKIKVTDNWCTSLWKVFIASLLSFIKK